MLRAVTTQGFLQALSGKQPLARVTAARVHPHADGLNFISIASGTNTMNVRAMFYAPRDASLSDLIVALPAFYQNLPEANFPTNFTATATVEYPVGTFTVVRWAGAASQIVTAGYPVYYSDPTPVRIPANTLFYVKLFLSWTGGVVNFPLFSCGATVRNTEWTTVGIGLSDNTATTTTLSPSYVAPPHLRGLGFVPALYARMSAPLPVLAILGDSIDQGVVTGELADSVYGGTGWERGMRNVVPVLNMARQAETAAGFLTRPNGRLELSMDAITHAMIGYGRNDMDTGASAATLLTNNRRIVDYFNTRGVKTYLRTITPRTTSSDDWITTANQTVTSAGVEAQRVLYNADIRANWRSYGLAGIFDVAAVVDPTNSGKWEVDGTTGNQGSGVATMSGTAVASVARPVFNAGTAYGGMAYPINQAALECVVYRYPDDPVRSGDATVTCATDGSGVVSGLTGSGGAYTYAPMITPRGQWTRDGTHPTNRGYNAMIAGAGIGPQALAIG
jgi:hypothetical protein